MIPHAGPKLTFLLKIIRTEGGFRIEDAATILVCYVYCREPEREAGLAFVHTFENGQLLAQKIARLLTDSSAAA